MLIAPMLKSLRVQGFGPFADVTVGLEPFSVLIGPNNSGKTSFVRALHLAMGLQTKPLSHILGTLGLTAGPWLFHNMAVNEITLTARYASGALHAVTVGVGRLLPTQLDRPYDALKILREEAEHVPGLRFTREEPDLVAFGDGDVRIKPDSSAVSAIWDTRLDAREAIAAGLGRPVVWGFAPEGGEDLATTYLDMLKERPEAYPDVMGLLRQIPTLGALKGIRLEPMGAPSADTLFFDFPFGKLPASMVSKGLLALFGYYLVLGMASPGDLLWIEEPERGMHPEALDVLIKNLHAGATKVGVQVVLVTHSPDTVNVVHRIHGDNDRRAFLRSVVTFFRDGEAQPSVHTLADAPDTVLKQLDTYFLGELWALRGELPTQAVTVVPSTEPQTKRGEPMIKTSLAAIVAVAALVSASLPAYAGYKGTYPVVVDLTGRSARGALGSARNSANSTEYILCYLQVGGAYPFYGCDLRNAAGVTGSCQTSDANLIAQLRALRGDDYIEIKWDTSVNPQCTSITINKGSYFEPKAL